MGIPFLEDALKEKGLLPEDHRPEDGLETAAPDVVIEENFDDELNKKAMDNMISQKAEQTLAMIEGIDHGEAMDKIYSQTLKHANDLVDLAYNVPENRMRGMFEQANAMYGKAIDAKNSKRDSQLKAMKLALEKRRIDLEEKKINHLINGSKEQQEAQPMMVEDRNALIKMKRDQLNKDK